MTTDCVLRGGSWGNNVWAVRSARRYTLSPGCRFADLGFRPVAKAVLPHVMRGSSWLDVPRHSRCAVRFSAGPGLFKRFEHFGFRPVAKAQQ